MLDVTVTCVELHGFKDSNTLCIKIGEGIRNMFVYSIMWQSHSPFYAPSHVRQYVVLLNMSIPTIRYDLAIATHDEKLHNKSLCLTTKGFL